MDEFWRKANNGQGETLALLRGLDWRTSTLGHPSTWPVTLRTAVDMMLSSRFPMFVAWGPDLGFLYNDAYALILGEKHPAALGGRFADIWREIWSDIAPIVERALTNEPSYFEDLPLTVVRHGYPEQSYFTFSYSPLHGSAGDVEGMYCTVMETTARVLAEQKLREADRRKDEFLAMLAHELRNPLAPIAAAAELLHIMHPGEERVRSASAVIRRQVAHMTTLVDDLLDVSRVTHGLVALSRSPVALRSIVEEAIEQVTPAAQARRQQLEVHLPPHDVSIPCDKARLVQVLANLLNNASKYSAPETMIAVRATVEGNEAVLTVHDQGLGMDAELIARVFEPFSQAERSSARSLGGLGLGLALVRQLVHLHGGAVTATSPGPGRGSTFVVRLPLAPA
jgi:signal transduction histidine kinase